MSDPRKPDGLTDEEWNQVLTYALQRQLKEAARKAERQAYEQHSQAFDADRSAFTRFANRLGFVRRGDARLHADFDAFRPDVPRA